MSEKYITITLKIGKRVDIRKTDIIMTELNEQGTLVIYLRQSHLINVEIADYTGDYESLLNQIFG